MLLQILANGSLRKRFTVNGFARFKSTMSFLKIPCSVISNAARNIFFKFLTFVRNNSCGSDRAVYPCIEKISPDFDFSCSEIRKISPQESGGRNAGPQHG